MSPLFQFVDFYPSHIDSIVYFGTLLKQFFSECYLAQALKFLNFIFGLVDEGCCVYDFRPEHTQCPCHTESKE